MVQMGSKAGLVFCTSEGPCQDNEVSRLLLLLLIPVGFFN